MNAKAGAESTGLCGKFGCNDYSKLLDIPLLYDNFLSIIFNTIPEKGVGYSQSSHFYDYEVKPTVNCVELDVVFGISYTYIV